MANWKYNSNGTMNFGSGVNQMEGDGDNWIDPELLSLARDYVEFEQDFDGMVGFQPQSTNPYMGAATPSPLTTTSSCATTAAPLQGAGHFSALFASLGPPLLVGAPLGHAVPLSAAQIAAPPAVAPTFWCHGLPATAGPLQGAGDFSALPGPRAFTDLGLAGLLEGYAVPSFAAPVAALPATAESSTLNNVEAAMFDFNNDAPLARHGTIDPMLINSASELAMEPAMAPVVPSLPIAPQQAPAVEPPAEASLPPKRGRGRPPGAVCKQEYGSKNPNGPRGSETRKHQRDEREQERANKRRRPK